MENFELHDSALVIDGNAIACQLYNRHTKSNDCFGGDYDSYGKVVSDFYELLKQCNITPYVLFDGGYERKKLSTVISRMKARINTARKLDITSGQSSVFPLFLRDTFLGITQKLKIKVARCDFESDTEIANIARALNCPVLSYDSDFFIFDVMYIPFSTFELNLKKGQESECKYKYISCEIYKVENFLKSYDLDKNNLPLLAVLLGNDYVKRSVFSMFYRNLKVQKCHGSEEQKRIKSLIVWLQSETLETAISKVLSRFKCHKRKFLAKIIHRAMEGYNCYDSIYIKYLGIEPVLRQQMKQFDIDILFQNVQEEDHPEEDLNDSSNESGTEDNAEEPIDSVSADSSIEDTQPKDAMDNTDIFLDENTRLYFLERFRKCLYPACCMDILLLNTYYCVPQVENYLEEQSHTVSMELISAIKQILNNSDTSLKCVVRIAGTNLGTVEVPVYCRKLPTLLEIESYRLKLRQVILLDILDLQKSSDFLGLLPPSWHIFIMSILYLINKASISWSIVYALVISKIILGHADSKLGYIRSSKGLHKCSQNLPPDLTPPTYPQHFVNHLDRISLKEYACLLKSVIHYFSIPEKLQRNPKLFDINFVHMISQFQSCLLHINYLNSLLNFPFENSLASEILNCTFIYHLASNLSKRSNLDMFIEGHFSDSKNLFGFFNMIIIKLKEFSVCKVVQSSKRKRRRKHRKSKSVEEENELMVESDNEEPLYDPNNKFSVLAM